MNEYESIRKIEKRIREITGSSHGISSIDFLIPTENQNAFVVYELGDEADIAVCLKKELLNELSSKSFPEDFDLQILSSLSIAVEELSHFNYYCEKAIRNINLSPLEMEIQAEVDKFAFALDILQERNEGKLRDEVFSIMFDQLQLGEWVSENEKSTYEAAHHIARSFCRKMLNETRLPQDSKEWFRTFYRLESHLKTKA